MARPKKDPESKCNRVVLSLIPAHEALVRAYAESLVSGAVKPVPVVIGAVKPQAGRPFRSFTKDEQLRRKKKPGGSEEPPGEVIGEPAD